MNETYFLELRALLERLSSNRDLTSTYGPAVPMAAVILELRKLRHAIEKTQEKSRVKGRTTRKAKKAANEGTVP